MLFAPKVKIVIKKKILYIERDLSIQTTMLAATLKVQITQTSYVKTHLSHLGVFVIKSAFMLEFKKLQH